MTDPSDYNTAENCFSSLFVKCLKSLLIVVLRLLCGHAAVCLEWTVVVITSFSPVAAVAAEEDTAFPSEAGPSLVLQSFCLIPLKEKL